MSFKAQIPVRSVTMPNLLNILFFALTVFTATALASHSDVTFKFDELSGPPSAGRLPVRSQEFARSPLLEVDELSNAVRLARGLHLNPPKFGRYLPGRRTPTIGKHFTLSS